MRFFETIAVAFSMFSAIPMPQFPWNKENMRYALCAFPVIGLLIGGICIGVHALGELLALSSILIGLILCVVPLIVTGGIHMDGAMDTWDARASHADREKKLEILKDPHIGSFAVIRLAVHLLLLTGCWMTLPQFDSMAVLLIFCMSRTLSGLAVATFPMAKNTGLAHTFAESADKKRVASILYVFDGVLCVCMILFSEYGYAAVIAAHLVYLYYHAMAKREFGGITGDLAGWFLQNCELWMLIAIYAVQIGERFL